MAGKNRRSITLSLRFSVFDRDKRICQYCGAKGPNVELHIDHVHPVALGGDNRIDNLLTACRDCNIGKGARDPGLAMADRPYTQLERMFRESSEVRDEAMSWAECAFWGADISAKYLMWRIAARADLGGVELPLPDVGTPERAEVERLLSGLVAVGAIRCFERGEWAAWMLIEEKRGRVDDPGVPWGLGCIGHLGNAPSVAEVH